jgi:Holliday junction resolvase RusA-like endonuclease
MESNTSDESLAAKEVARFTSPVRVRVVSYRKYSHDTDGCSVKAVLDGLTRCGILASDSSDFVKEITFESVKSADEKTVITIEEYI